MALYEALGIGHMLGGFLSATIIETEYLFVKVTVKMEWLDS